MTKIDLKKELKHLYSASAKEAAVVEVPEMNFLMIDGSGDPDASEEFQDAVGALYGLSYTLKFMIKKGERALDYKVMPLEGLWWVEGEEAFDIDRRELWRWTLMIMQPEFVTAELVERAAEEVERKKSPPALEKARFESFREGLSAQIMHVGPYCDEGPTIERLHAFIRESGRQPRGKHHEIYMGDPRRTAPERLKTILRQPMA